MKFWFAPAILLIGVLAACSDSFKESSSPGAFVRPVASLPIPDTMTRTQFREVAVTVETSDEVALANAIVAWHSSNESAVHVAASGTPGHALLTAQGLGEAEITAAVKSGIGSVPQTLLVDTVHVLEKWLSASSGRDLACALNVDSIAYCWNLGFGARTEPAAVKGLFDFPARSLEVGHTTACVIVLQENPYCWGKNTMGEMGKADVTPHAIATEALPNRPLGSLRTISAGGTFFCGTFFFRGEQDPTPFLYCWGNAAYGQLGAEASDTSRCSFNFRNYPCVLRAARDIQPPPDERLIADSVSAGESHACAIRGTDMGFVLVAEPGSLYCWGPATTGQLGPGDPARPFGLCPDDVQLLTNPDGVSCARFPVKVSADLRFLSVSAGWDIFVGNTPNDVFSPSWLTEGHTCGVSTSLMAYCWGKNNHGQLGAPSDSNCVRAFNNADLGLEPTVPCRATPALVLAPAPGTFKSVSAGSEHTCGIMTDDKVYCWGGNESGQLGDGAGGTSQSPSPGSQRMTPAPIASDRKFTSLSSGPTDTCGVTDDGSIYCWGEWYGNVPTRLPEPQ